MAIKKKVVLAPALAIGSLALVTLVQVASATHPRPKGATPLRVSLAIAYKPCASPNRAHGPPLAAPSCNPPVQVSNFLTVGTPDADGADANSVGFLLIQVKASGPEDVLITGAISDVRCKPATDSAVCNSSNAVGGPDYSGDLEPNTTIRGTDHFNGPVGSGSGGTDPGTMEDVPSPLGLFHCVNTPDTSVGGTCTVDTFRPLIPTPYWFEGKRVVAEISQIQVSDGGVDGNVFTRDNTLFAVQGVFVP